MCITNARCLLLFCLTILLSLEVYVANKEGRRIHKLRYYFHDWRPHFGYVPGHYASDHRSRYKQANLTHSATVKPRGRGLSAMDAVHLESYVVRLLMDKKFICSGLIVNTQHVLTTSICLVNVPLNKLEVKLFDGSLYTVKNQSSGSGFTPGLGQELLVLLLLDKELQQQYNEPPPICPRRVSASAKVQLWSWDKRKVLLKKLLVEQVPQATCKRLINDKDGDVVMNATMCLQNNRFTKKCEPSFGLPYVWEGNFCGMNLLGHNCPKEAHADVYVRMVDVKRYVADKLNVVKNSGIEDALF